MALLSPELVSGYLKRVGHSSSGPVPRSNVQSLANLQKCHLEAIPFENLSLRLEAAEKQHPTKLELGHVYRKMVDCDRGGVCYEHNALFAAVLRSLGFDVADAAARVVGSSALPGEASEGVTYPPPPELTLGSLSHHILLVRLEGRIWLADVGFGGECPPLPLLLPEDANSYTAPPPDTTAADAYQGHDWAAELPVERMRRYRLRLGLPGVLAPPNPATTPRFASRAGYYLQCRRVKDGSWKDLYFFRLDECIPRDYEAFCFNITANPSGMFRSNTLVGRQTGEGRVTILNDEFRVWQDGKLMRTEKIEGEKELMVLLDLHFGIRF